MSDTASSNHNTSADITHVDPETQPLLDHHHHKEEHFDNADVVRDILIGLSDGLTVPFALAAGLASLDNSNLVVTAGLAEIVAGSISMGLGGYLAGKSEIEHYDNERLREETEVIEVPHKEEEEIVEIFEPYGAVRSDVEPLISVLRRDPTKWVDFMMKFELNLEKPSVSRTWISALTIGFSYLFGGVIPLLPYVFISNATDALFVSIGVTLCALFLFGLGKGYIMGTIRPFKSAIEMTFIGAIAAAAAYGMAVLVSESSAATTISNFVMDGFKK